MIQKTSIDTFLHIKNEGLLSEKRLRVYEIFYEYGELTGAQVSEIYRSKYPAAEHSETIRNRITELVQMNCVKQIGTTQCDKTKRTVHTYISTNELPSQLKKNPDKKQILLHSLKRVESVASKIDDEITKEELRKLWRSLNYLNTLL
jgi:hypothetical protein